jgi:3-methyladenine DNA glycosylase Tag
MGGTAGAQSRGEEPASSGDGSSSSGGDPAAKPEGAELAAWGAQLSKELRGDANVVKGLSKFKNIDDLAKAYHELSGKLGTMAAIPGKDATDDERAAFYARLGRPESPEKYGVKTDSPEAKAFAKAMFDAGLSADQATRMNAFIESTAEISQKAQVEAAARMSAETETQLKAKYKDKYPERVANLERAMKVFGNPELIGALNQSGLAFHPAVVEFFMDIGDRMGEAGATRRGGGSTKKMLSLAEGGSFSYAT